MSLKGIILNKYGHSYINSRITNTSGNSSVCKTRGKEKNDLDVVTPMIHDRPATAKLYSMKPREEPKIKTPLQEFLEMKKTLFLNRESSFKEPVIRSNSIETKSKDRASPRKFQSRYKRKTNLLNPLAKTKIAPIPNLQSNSTVWVQEIVARLDDIQKLRGLIDIEKQIFKKDNSKNTSFKSDLEEFFSKMNHNEHMRQIKENTNLGLLSKINFSEEKIPNKKNEKLKIQDNDADSSYFATTENKDVVSSGKETKGNRSLSTHKSEKNMPSNYNHQFSDNKINDKIQYDAGIRRFMKKVVTRILKRIYLSLTTSKLPNAIEYRDFSQFNLCEIMDEKLPNENSKK